MTMRNPTSSSARLNNRTWNLHPSVSDDGERVLWKMEEDEWPPRPTCLEKADESGLPEEGAW